MSFKIALLVLTAFIGAQAQNYNLVTCSGVNRTDNWCGSQLSGANINACCATVYTINRNTTSGVQTNATTTPSFYCLPIDLVGRSANGTQFQVYKAANNMATIYHAICNNTNRTEAATCTGADDESCKSDTKCCATETVSVGLVNSTVGNQSVTATSNVCVAKDFTATNSSSSSQHFALTYSCLPDTDEDSFASFVKISMAVLAVMGLAFF